MQKGGKERNSVATASEVRCLSLLFGLTHERRNSSGWVSQLIYAPDRTTSHHLRTRISISLLVFPTPRVPSYQLISSLCNGPRKWVKSRSDSLIWHFLESQFWTRSHSHSFPLSLLLNFSFFLVGWLAGELGWQSAFCFGIFFHICLTRLCVLNCHFSWQFNLDYAEATEQHRAVQHRVQVGWKAQSKMIVFIQKYICKVTDFCCIYVSLKNVYIALY